MPHFSGTQNRGTIKLSNFAESEKAMGGDGQMGESRCCLRMMLNVYYTVSYRGFEINIHYDGH